MKLYHPLWTHAAAFAMLLTIGFVLLSSLSAPGELPQHWGPPDASGARQPDRWGPAWELPLAMLFFGAMMTAIGVGLDGLWAQHLAAGSTPSAYSTSCSSG